MTDLSFKGLKQYCYFSGLSDAALEEVFNKMHPVEYPAGTEMIKPGDASDAFYFIGRGEVEVVKTSRSGNKASASVSGQGPAFGEMALLTCSPRDCTVTAKTGVTGFKIFKNDFEEIVRKDSAISEVMERPGKGYTHFNTIKSLRPFALLEPEKIAALTDKLGIKEYSAGEKIITQGEKGDLYYIMKSGKASVLKMMLDVEPEHVATIEVGEGFGEEALLTDSPRSATVKAVDDTVVWTLSKEDFNTIAKSSCLKEVRAEEVLSDTRDTIAFLDVRMNSEFEEEHIYGAINIPLDELRRRYEELDRATDYYVYCLLGARSATAAFLMNNQGLRARSIIGGIQNWPGALEKRTDGVHTPMKPT